MKFFSLLLVLVVVLSLCSCGKDEVISSVPSGTTQMTTEHFPQYAPDSIVLSDHPSNIMDTGNDEDYIYRALYYSIPGEILYLPVFDGFNPDYDRIENEMLMVTFIKHYNIEKEDFVATIQQLYERCKANEQDITHEGYELPNADIIYTFDNEVINAYYRRENPVTPEPGTYQTYESYEEYKKAMD